MRQIVSEDPKKKEGQEIVSKGDKQLVIAVRRRGKGRPKEELKEKRQRRKERRVVLTVEREQKRFLKKEKQ